MPTFTNTTEEISVGLVETTTERAHQEESVEAEGRKRKRGDEEEKE